MENQKHYIVDTNVLLDDPESLFKLRNGNENKVYIPFHVLLELNRMKKRPKLGRFATKAINIITEHAEHFTVLNSTALARPFEDNIDNYILGEIEHSDIERPVLITNDRVFQIQARLKGIHSENYKNSIPAKTEAEEFTGFQADDEENRIHNTFFWNDQNRPVFKGFQDDRIIDYQHRVWNVTPRNIYQNLAMELMINPNIHVVSFQSEAGYGKSFLALAAAFYLVLQEKRHEKIYIVKPTVEIGQKLGYLPGKVEEKMEPYMRYVSDLVQKLHRLRSANRIFGNPDAWPQQFDPKKFEILPLAYIRGMNIEDAVVIVDEVQNMTRAECRALLSRMGDGVKCFCLGDIHQVDNPYLDKENNGLNWIVNKFKGSPIYAHFVLKGDRSRGPITDLVIRSGF